MDIAEAIDVGVIRIGGDVESRPEVNVHYGPLFLLAAIMAALVGLGPWHARRTPTEARMLEPEPVAST